MEYWRISDEKIWIPNYWNFPTTFAGFIGFTIRWISLKWHGWWSLGSLRGLRASHCEVYHGLLRWQEVVSFPLVAPWSLAWLVAWRRVFVFWCRPCITCSNSFPTKIHLPSGTNKIIDYSSHLRMANSGNQHSSMPSLAEGVQSLVGKFGVVVWKTYRHRWCKTLGLAWIYVINWCGN